MLQVPHGGDRVELENISMDGDEDGDALPSNRIREAENGEASISQYSLNTTGNPADLKVSSPCKNI